MRAQIQNDELILDGDVGDMWGDGNGLMANDVRTALAGRSGPITVRVNSGGGWATEGAAIHAVLMAYPDKKTVYVEGIAASAASLMAMAADDLVMTEGSLLMIHDPAGMTIGTADDHRMQADALDTMANEYAKVYARKSGSTVEAMRDVMREELWMGSEEAVSLGFADRVETRQEEPTMADFPYQKYNAAPDKLVLMARENGWSAGGPRPKKATKRAASEEAVMAEKETSAEQKTPNPETPVKVEMQIDPQAVAALAAQERRVAVMSVAGERLTAAEVEAIVEGHKDAAEAKMAAVDLVCEKRMQADPKPHRSAAVVVEDEKERNVEAMIGALGATIFGTKLEGAAQEYRGMTPKRLAIDLAGGFKYGHSDMDLIKSGMFTRGALMSGGMHSTSDFAYITSETLNRQLRAAYEASPGTWRPISRPRTAIDFRPLYSVQAGVDTELRSVNEAGEYESTVLTDAGESFKLGRKGRSLSITFEAIVNDDMSAFARLPSDFARGSLNFESSLVWSLINANGNLSDGTAIFATGAARRNLASSGGAISVATVGAGYKAMLEQRPLGAKATGSDFISCSPNMLYVPPLLNTVAKQFVSNTTPDTDGNTNPYKNELQVMIEPRLGATVNGGSDTAWYLFDTRLPILEHAYLQGYEAPQIIPEETRNPKGVTMLAEHIFGAGIVEYRGAYKNAGA